MISISRSAEVAYSAERMYDLINDVRSYPEFLTWCREAKVIEQSDLRLTATLKMAVGGIKQVFTTRNTMLPGRRIDIHLVEGPFKQLTGYWLFEPVSEQRCRVAIKMEFEYKNRWLRLALDKIFSHIIDTLIDTFTERARRVYGGN